jgi:hypothetical protein
MWSAATGRRFFTPRLVAANLEAAAANLGADKSPPTKALTSQRTPKRKTNVECGDLSPLFYAATCRG